MRGRSLDGRVVIVTGASSGIGAATAVACGRAGMRVVLAARRAGLLAAGAAEVSAAGAAARVVPTDVGDEAAVRALVDGTVGAWGRLDVLVNNAGIGILATADQTTPAEFERLVRVNYLGAVHGVLAALPHMRRQGAGHVVNVASVLGKRASPYRAAYVASKFALVGFSEALRMELRSTGIDVTCVCPIGTATEFHDVEPNRLGVSGRGGPIQSAEHVARAIVRALRRPRPEVHPYPPARLLFLANAVAPGLVDRLMMRFSPRARAR
ncbi:MAG TPA: SDR family oxidoreductase [Methylomirabilota bacterium]|nr:SDR family oxidoreductase [Methylomirabilota bacterium]